MNFQSQRVKTRVMLVFFASLNFAGKSLCAKTLPFTPNRMQLINILKWPPRERGVISREKRKLVAISSRGRGLLMENRVID